MSKTYERQELFLNWVKTLAVVGGIGFALWELSSKLDQLADSKAQNSIAYLVQFSTPAISSASASLLKRSGQLQFSDQQWTKFLSELEPLHQVLQSWAACHADQLCVSPNINMLFCERIAIYEEVMKRAHLRARKDYDAAKRYRKYFGEMGKCKKLTNA